LRGRNGNGEFGGHTSRGLIPPRREVADGFPRSFEDRGRRRLGRAAVKRRLRRIDHIQLDRLRGFVAAQFSGEPQRAVDAGGDARGKDLRAVHDHAFVNRDSAKVPQQVK